MQTPEYVGSSAARMIVALTLFLGIVTAGVWFAVRPELAPEKTSNSSTLAAAADVPGDFFYKSIGGGPALADDAAPASALKVSYTLELQVATDRDEAEKLIDDLEKRGVEAYYTPLSRGGHVVYRVRRGIFPTQKAAAKAAMALKTEHKLSSRVVKLQ